MNNDKFKKRHKLKENSIGPNDWVLGKDGKYIWVENVTSPTDINLNGRKYIGPQKYDAYNNALKNRSAWEKLWGSGPNNVDWNSYYTPLLTSYAQDLINIQSNRQIIPLSQNDIEFNYRHRFSQDKLSPSVEPFGNIKLDNTPRRRAQWDSGSVEFNFNITIGEKKILAVASFARMFKHQEYISRFNYGSSLDRTVMDRFDNFSLLFGNKFRSDVFVITFKSKEDYYEVAKYIGHNF
ncbi:hypothetical protein [Cellulophaga baltica]|uniref:hypothetical protein n=1 Tax=Cellulophaga baltica TaxID=76594 RepID=UPI002493EC42|nr:hypothetical protein [Cellulophaga baltica]